MEKLTNILNPQQKADKLRVAWSEASNYPDVDWNPANEYVSMLERKIIEQDRTIELLQDKIEALEALGKARRQWANGEIEN
ncbi:MAG: hypothetical protein CMH62_03740 [Nanoarchaeota archaeon]|nr:hypothetical protein [Nanoarchaeota archaeon]|tara:strand:- start:361 stop:603 length:243 start_codon:yes stop_codon:yes gene_type:complete